MGDFAVALVVDDDDDDDATRVNKAGFLEETNRLLESGETKAEEGFAKDVAQRANTQLWNLAELFTLLILSTT
jgi:hypothetical protein